MTYRKFKADHLFTGSTTLNGDQVLVTDSNGRIMDIVNEIDAGNDIELLTGMLTPGFINGHCHLELSHLKNVIPEKTGLVEFVFNVVTGRHFEPDEITSSIKNAEDEMYKSGIVAVGDICNNSLSLAQKENSPLHYYNFIEISGWHPEVAEARFQKSKSFYDAFVKKNQKTAIVPHAPYSVSKKLWGKITPHFPGKVISIHNQETRDEDNFFLNGTGALIEMYKKMNINNSFYQPRGIRSLPTYFEYLHNAASVILVHNTFTKQEDLDYIFRTKSPDQLLSFCLCVNANLYIENSLPPVEMFLQNDCNIIIGTDSLASNHQLNILDELKTITKKFPGIKTETLLQWATMNGARALQMDDISGSFEKGKQPGIVLIEKIIDEKITENSVARRIL